MGHLPQKLQSTLSLEGIKSEFIIKQLENASHYPSEDPGVDQLLDYILDFVKTYH